MERRHLPVIPDEGEFVSSIATDGHRRTVVPADVSGRFWIRRKIVFGILVAIWLLLPVVKVSGAPLLFLDVGARRFHVFGFHFGAQDTFLLFFLLTAVGFTLLFATALLGRAWCGWACPQTVFLEGLFRPIERWIGGPRDARIRRARGPWNLDRILRTLATHALYAVAAVFVAHVFVSFFVSVPTLLASMRSSPTKNLETFAWMATLSVAFYVNFAWFREQLCVVVCPYGRLQSVLLDDHSLVVGYDERRGEPRGKVGDAAAGDCVDCKRCVAVCPTGIDIRNGLQLDCVACTACIDACDGIMDRLGRPRGLVRYDSLEGLRGRPRKILRPRVLAYSGLAVVGAFVLFLGTRGRVGFEANLLRNPGTPWVVDGDEIRNGFELHVVNSGSEARRLAFRATFPPASEGIRAVFGVPDVTMAPFEHRRVPVVVRQDRDHFRGDVPFTVDVTLEGGRTKSVPGRFLGVSR